MIRSWTSHGTSLSGFTLTRSGTGHSVPPATSVAKTSASAGSCSGETHCATRAPGPIANRSPIQPANWPSAACDWAIPLGRPVEPEVNAT
ncbi:hypothetical protein DIJ69_34045 (plasmid) [Streptomyces globisporus]|nr:hypothetical protein DIJ69_34045 [Streptomyces globisporus]